VTGRDWDAGQAISEHEAAHCVVAQHLGVHLDSVRIDRRGFGHTLVVPHSPEIDAAVSAAGDVWDSVFAGRAYKDGSCRDLQMALEQVGIHGMWGARRTAKKILTANREQVRQLARQLHREGEIVFSPR
jgi:hypothetical protein